MKRHLVVRFRRCATGAGVLAILLCAGAAAAQTPPLGDVARQEADRRKTQPSGGKVYTNKDLPEAARQRVPPPAPDAQPEADAQSAAGRETAAPDGPKRESARGEAWWRARMAKALDEVRRNEQLADELQSRINALTRDFTSRDNPVQRAQVGQDRAAALTELARVQQELELARRRIGEIEDEARRAGVPPGWLR